MLFNSTVMCLRHFDKELFKTSYITGWKLLVSERERCPEPLVCTKSGRKSWMDRLVTHVTRDYTPGARKHRQGHASSFASTCYIPYCITLMKQSSCRLYDLHSLVHTCT